MDALVPGFAYFASWYVLGAIAFAFIAMETRGRTIDDANRKRSARTRALVRMLRRQRHRAIQQGSHG